METKKVLLVEDDGTLRSLYTDLLESEGFKVDQAVEGEEGLTKLKNGGWDLVLLDVLLPGLEGPQILEKLAQAPPIKSNGPIVMLTNQDSSEVLNKCRDLGAAGAIIKSSVPTDQFIRHVRSYLAK